MRLNVLIINLVTFWAFCRAQSGRVRVKPAGPPNPPPITLPTTTETTDDYGESDWDKIPTIPENEIEEALNPGGDAVSPMDYIFWPFNIQNWYPDGMNLGTNEYCIEQYIRCALSSVYPHSNCSYYWYHNGWWRYFWSNCAYRMDGCRRRFRLFHYTYLEQTLLPQLNARDVLPIRTYRHLCAMNPNYP